MYLPKTAQPIDNLPDAVCSFDEYAMNLDQSIGHDSFKSREKMFVIIRTVGIVIKYVLIVHRGVR